MRRPQSTWKSKFDEFCRYLGFMIATCLQRVKKWTFGTLRKMFFYHFAGGYGVHCVGGYNDHDSIYYILVAGAACKPRSLIVICSCLLYSGIAPKLRNLSKVGHWKKNMHEGFHGSSAQPKCPVEGQSESRYMNKGRIAH